MLFTRTLSLKEFLNSTQYIVLPLKISASGEAGRCPLSLSSFLTILSKFKLIFCVVHKVNKPNRERRSVANSYSFSLKKYGFNDIITNNVSFFRQQFIKKIDQNLSC
jgi:hypothetical protein